MFDIDCIQSQAGGDNKTFSRMQTFSLNDDQKMTFIIGRHMFLQWIAFIAHESTTFKQAEDDIYVFHATSQLTNRI